MMEPLTVIGVTSQAEGISAVFVRFSPDLSFEFIDKYFFEYENNFSERIGALFRENVNASELCQINFDISEKFVEAANILISRNKKPDLIAMGGLTIRHIPQKSILQIGEASFVAQKTGILTVSNFHSRDIAAGGNGDTLACFADEKLFKKTGKTVAIINMGDNTSATLVGRDFDTLYFDVGAGASLLNYYTKRFFNAPYDEELCAGEVNNAWLDVLLSDEFYKKEPPKILPYNYFSKFYAEKALRAAPENVYDVITTTCALIARTISDAISPFAPEEVVLGGDGFQNPTLLRFLRSCLPQTTAIKRYEDYGLPGDFKEAFSVALLGYTSYWGVPNNLPSCSGATRRVVLGEATL